MIASPNTRSPHLGAQVLTGIVAFVCLVGSTLLLVTPEPGPISGIAVLVALFATATLATREFPNYVVTTFGPRINGVRLSGEPLALLADIENRFDYAHRVINEIPTGIRWSDVASHVEVLLWDAAEHAGRVAELDGELQELRYAAPGTPQAEYKATLAERRAEHDQAMRSVQWEAEDLARHAGTAAAAARLALARTGDKGVLEVVAPSAPVVLAVGGLAEAKQRLAMLSEVWSELDPGADPSTTDVQ